MELRWAPSLVRPVLLLAPLLLPRVVPLAALPPAVAYVVSEGRWLVVLGALCAEVSLILEAGGWSLEPLRAWMSRALSRCPPRAFAALVWTSAFAGMLLVVPGHCYTGDSLGGDEPKYLRLTESLYRDLDVDMAGQSTAPLTLGRLAGNVRALAASTRDGIVGLWRSEPVPPGHAWNRGNWTLAGRRGGLFYLQSPGLPVLLVPGLALQRTIMPAHSGPLFPLITLAALWATALWQTARLAEDVLGSRSAALLGAVPIALSAPLFIGGYAFYPEAPAVAAVPWLLRHAIPGRPRPGPARGLALVLVAGALVWLHPKFLFLSLALLVALLVRLRRPGLVLVGALPLFALLLYDHEVTGLLRPDALYIRYGSPIYRGLGSFASLNMFRGLLNALVSARDGLLIIAPVTTAGVFALPLLVRDHRRAAFTLAAVFGSHWLAVAVHDGKAPGPPGRLLAPVACALVVPLALGFLRLWRSLAYRWTVALLAMLTVLITLTLLVDWHRSVKPYRHMFSPATDFARDLPAGPPSDDRPVERTRGLEIARGTILVALVVFWTWVFHHMDPETAPPPYGRWRAIRNVHLAWWGTLAVGSGLLRAVGS